MPKYQYSMRSGLFGRDRAQYLTWRVESAGYSAGVEKTLGLCEAFQAVPARCTEMYSGNAHSLEKFRFPYARPGQEVREPRDQSVTIINQPPKRPFTRR